MTVEHRSSEEIRRLAIEQGMRTLREDGLLKVRLGITSREEVLRIVEGRTGEEKPVEESVVESVVPLRGRRKVSGP